MDPSREDTIGLWVSDFCDSQALRDQDPAVREQAPEVLAAFLEGACAQRDVEPRDIEEADLKPALLEHVGSVSMTDAARAGVPSLCAAFLGEMQAQGRLAGGRRLGLYVRALRGPFLTASQGRTEQLHGPETKLGRNDPCPCGSGRKYKKCCMGLLDR
jgi:hypothetical protein